MQTFLPYSGAASSAMEIYEESAHLLDIKRLGKQRVENYQIMQALFGRKLDGEVYSVGWSNHPAVKMWRGYEFSLLKYQVAVCDEWIHNFGFKDTCKDKTIRLYFMCADLDPKLEHKDPPWLGDIAFHKSHQSNLIRKAPLYYRKYFPGVPDNLPYIWPVSNNTKE